MEDLNNLVSDYLARVPLGGDTRRKHERFQPQSPLPARLGRADVSIVDISLGGARVEHYVVIPRAANPRLRFAWAGEEFDAPAHILSSRLISIGDQRRIVTRLSFPNLSPDREALLRRITSALSEERIARWTANLHGNGSSTLEPEPVATRWIAYALSDGRWEGRVVSGGTLPSHGFVVPETLPPAELRAIFDLYPSLDPDARELLRRCLIAAGGDVGALA